MSASRDRNKQASAETPSEQTGGPPWVLIGGVLAVAALAVVALYPTSAPETGVAVSEVADASAASESTPVVPVAVAEASEAEPEATVTQIIKPDPDAPLPPLPFIPNMVPRPAEVISAVYEYAARNPDVLEFVPCFCGCETAGHKANAHCFVQSRNPDGTVKEWETHGMGCAVCIDVARDSMQLHASGASTRDVRSAIEAKYADRFPRMTPTPQPPE